MKKIFILLIVLLSVNFVMAEEVENYNNYQSLEIDFLLDSDVELTGDGSLTQLTASVFLNPRSEGNQEIKFLDEFSTPNAEISSSGDLIYEWTDKNSNYNFGYNAKIKINNILYPVPEIKFPYDNIPNEYQQYLQHGEVIDVNQDIIKKTSEIIGNEDNAYLVVHKIASWTNQNIEYSLNTLTEKASKKSSWVLENRQGVCDELTVLFISMVRSAGIPARFVAGMAYTNVGYYFGNHGWAEVYFQDVGWVPYDVTYGQFGYIDPSHFSLQKSFDIDSSISYQWKSSGDLKLNVSKEIETDAKISKLGNEINPVFDMSIKALKNDVTPGSYVPIRVKIKNPYDKYISDQIVISRAPGLVERNVRNIALKPLEEKEVYWIVEIPENVASGYVYTTLVGFTDLFGSKDKTIITFGESSKFSEVTLEEAQKIVDALDTEEDEQYSNLLFLNCNPGKSYYYAFEEAEVNCLVRSFNSQINDLSICLKDSCENFNLQKNREIDFTFKIEPTNELIPISLRNQEIDMNRNVLLFTLEKPEIKISKIDLNEVNYNEEIEFQLTISSETPVEEVVLKVSSLNPVFLKDFENSKEMTLALNTKSFNSERIKIKLEFLDEYGNSYSQEYIQGIKVNNLPWYWKIINIFRG